MKNPELHRMCCLINALGTVREEYCEKKMLEKDVGSRYVYENTQASDKLPTEMSDICVHVCRRFGHLRLTGADFAETRVNLQ